MSQSTDDRSYRAGFFGTVTQAEEAVHSLLAAGFTNDDLAVICPEQFKDRCLAGVPRAKLPGSNAATAMMEGSAIGAALGGIALAAAVIATGGIALVPAIPVLIGGGAIAGGLSSVFAADGYGKGIGSFYEEAIRQGKIVVGVHLEGEGSAARLAEAERILEVAEAQEQVALAN
jgi:hypothetical protein